VNDEILKEVDSEYDKMLTNKDDGTAKKRLTEYEQISNLDKKIKQLKEQKQAIESRAKEKERKARTRRLIQNGALAEKYLNCENMEPEEFEKYLARAYILIQNGALAEKYLGCEGIQSEEFEKFLLRLVKALNARKST